VDATYEGERTILLVVSSLPERVAQPLQPFVETITGGGASRLDVLGTRSAGRIDSSVVGGLTQARCLSECKPSLSVISAAFMAFFPHISSVSSMKSITLQAYRQILLVGKDQKQSIPQLILIQHTLQLLTSFDNTIAIIAINDEDDTLGVLEVMPPQRSDLILSPHVPHGKLDVLVLDGLDVEAWGAGVSALVSPRKGC